MPSPSGLDHKNINEIQALLTEHLKEKDNYSIYFFGSRATSQYRQYSDLDLWINSTPSLSTTELGQLRELFEESNLPIKVDLVTDDSCTDDFKKGIHNKKVFWFGK